MDVEERIKELGDAFPTLEAKCLESERRILESERRILESIERLGNLLREAQ
jgi:hypothetical protein